MAGKKVALLSRDELIKVLPEWIEVRKSARDNARYPLYLSAQFGPWHLNTPAGQELLLESAVFDGAPVVTIPEPDPEPAPELPGQNPEPDPPLKPGESEETQGFARSFINWMGDLD